MSLCCWCRTHFQTRSLPGGSWPFPLRWIPAVTPVRSVSASRTQGLLRLGMFLRTELPVTTHHDALLIPVPALYHDEANHPIVYLVAGVDATAADVKTGIITAEKVELLEGVKEGDTIVLTGGYGLGEKVEVKSGTGK